MKNFYFLFFALLITSLSFGQEIVFIEDFLTDGNGSRYSTSVAEFSDGTGGDFFTRTDGTTNVPSSYTITSGEDNGFYFAAMDTDGDGQPKVLTLNFDDIDISGFSNMTFVIDLAEDDDGSNQDWDADTSFTVEVDYDNAGSFTKILQFEAIGGTNTEPAQDTNFDGVGDGTTLTNEWQEFTATLGTGSLIDIRITFTNLDAGDEDIAIDLLGIAEDYDLFPEINISSPVDFSEFPPGTLSVDVVFSTENQQPGDRVDIIINSGTPIEDIASPYTILTADGQDYDVQLILTDGVDTLDENFVFFSVDSPLGIDENEILGLAIFPNPTSLGFVNIASKNNETITARVFDVLGKQVINTAVTDNRLNVSNLNPGLYFIKLIQNDATVTKKLVIK